MRACVSECVHGCEPWLISGPVGPHGVNSWMVVSDVVQSCLYRRKPLIKDIKVSFHSCNLTFFLLDILCSHFYFKQTNKQTKSPTHPDLNDSPAQSDWKWITKYVKLVLHWTFTILLLSVHLNIILCRRLCQNSLKLSGMMKNVVFSSPVSAEDGLAANNTDSQLGDQRIKSQFGPEVQHECVCVCVCVNA